MQTTQSNLHRIPTPRLAPGLWFSLILLLAITPGALAQSGTWTNLAGGNASGSWTNAANWNNGVIADGADNTADFSTLDISDLASTVTLDAARTIGNLIFGDTTPSTNWVLNTGAAGPLTLSVTAGSPTITVSNRTATIGAAITGTGGFAKAGPGTLRLGGANTLNGIININTGILQVDNNSALNIAGNSASTDRTVIADGATLEVISQRQPNNEHITVSGGGVGGTNGAIYANVGASGNANTRLSISLTTAANPAVTMVGDTTIRVDGTPNSSLLIGHITGGFTLWKVGGADLRIDPASGYSGGDLQILEGVLTIGNINGILGSQNVTVHPGAFLNLRNNNGLNSANSSLMLNGTLDLNSRGPTDNNAYNRQVGTLSGNGVITNGAAATQTFQVSSATADSPFNGVIQTKSTNGFINLVKNGAGTTLRLNGNNTYHGRTTLNAGTLLVNGSHTGSGGYVLNAGIFGGTGTVSSPITNIAAVIDAGDPASPGGKLTVLSDIVGSFGDVLNISNATLAVSGFIGPNSQYVGTLNMTNGTLEIPLRTLGPSAFVSTFNVDGNAIIKFSMATPLLGQFPIISCLVPPGGLAGFNGLTLVAPAGITATLSNNTAASTIDVVITGIPALTWEGSPGATWAVGSNNWKGGAIYADGQFVVFDDTAGGSTSVSVGSTVQPGGVVVNNNTLSYTFDGSGIISGTTGIAKQGSGSLTVVNSGNDFAGGVDLQQGTLQLGNGGSTGDLGSGPIANQGTLALNRSDTFTLANTVSGNGAITKAGAGTATVPVGGDSTGAVTVNAGTLMLAPAGTSKFSGDVTGGGAFGVNGAGTVILNGFNNTYSGGTIISSGTLQFGDELGSGVFPPAGNIPNNGTLAIALFGSLANNISGSGGLSIINNAAITLTGANTYTGPTVVLGGSLDAATSSWASGSVLTLGNQHGGPEIGAANFTAGNPVLGGLNAGGNNATASSVNLIAGNQTLTIQGNLTVGNSGPIGAVAGLTISGAGASVVVHTNGGTIQIGLGTAGDGQNPDNVVVDLTQVDRFMAELGATGTVNLGTLNGLPGPSGTGATVPNQLRLAAISNYLSAGTITMGAGGRQLIPELRLGAGTNILRTDTLNLGTGGRDGGALLFDSITGGVRVRAYDGVSRVNLNVGVNPGSTTGANRTNTVNLLGHSADLLLNALVVGNLNNAGVYECSFSFDQGTLDALSTSLSATRNTSTPAAIINAAASSSTLSIGGGIVSLGPVILTASAAAGNLNITGGSVTVHSISDTGPGTGTLEVNGATLNVDLQGFGNPGTAPISVDTFNANGTINLGVNGTGLSVGQFPLIQYTGAIGGTGFPALNLVSLPASVVGSLSNNTANLSVDLVITSAPVVVNPNPTNLTISASGGTLNLSWPADHLGWTLQTNAAGLDVTNAWFAYPGSSGVTNVALPIDPTQPNVYFRMWLAIP